MEMEMQSSETKQEKNILCKFNTTIGMEGKFLFCFPFFHISRQKKQELMQRERFMKNVWFAVEKRAFQFGGSL
jgi:hypothetical protein